VLIKNWNKNEEGKMNENVFMTKDLMSATYIFYSGVKLANISSGYDKKSRSWIFEDLDKCKELDFELRNEGSSVEVLKYESSRRVLLSLASGRD
jgi:hypothetical protein